MAHTEYKFERFIDPQFPVYASRQSGREVLVKPHYHQAGELMQVLEGRIRLLIGTAYRECEKGDIIFLPPSVAHEVLGLTPDAAIRGIVFDFSLIDAPKVLADFNEIFNRSQGQQYVITRRDAVCGELHGYIENIMSVYGTFSAGSRIKIVSNLLLIMGVYINAFSLEVSVHDKNYRKLKPVLDYIEEHYVDKISISELSEIIHVCDAHLIREFKNVTGETPAQYIINLRIESAIKLLSVGELSMSEIAEKTGFGSDTYMVRIFRQKLNTTPSKYKSK